jgi:ABC-type bacteriocin/lantibiotic exporter with double-glycine peptidase domain
MPDEQQYKFYLSIDKFKHKKLIIYAGKNERIIKKSDKIYVLSKGKIEAQGDFYSLSEYYNE